MTDEQLEWQSLKDACLRLYYHFLQQTPEWENTCIGVFEALKIEHPEEAAAVRVEALGGHKPDYHRAANLSSEPPNDKDGAEK